MPVQRVLGQRVKFHVFGKQERQRVGMSGEPDRIHVHGFTLVPVCSVKYGRNGGKLRLPMRHEGADDYPIRTFEVVEMINYLKCSVRINY